VDFWLALYNINYDLPPTPTPCLWYASGVVTVVGTYLERGKTMSNTLRLGGKALPATTTWERFASACVECQVWENPVWPEQVESEAVALAREYGFELFTWRSKEGLHGVDSVRKYERRPQEFWAEFATKLGFEFKQLER
jgi:hypothetical protein